MSRLLQWVYIGHQLCLGQGFHSPQRYCTKNESPDGIRLLLGSLCESAVSVSWGFPWVISKEGCVAQSELKQLQQEQRTVLADVIFLLSYKLPRRSTSCLCIRPPITDSVSQQTTRTTYTSLHVMVAVRSSLHVEVGLSLSLYRQESFNQASPGSCSYTILRC